MFPPRPPVPALCLHEILFISVTQFYSHHYISNGFPVAALDSVLRRMAVLSRKYPGQCLVAVAGSMTKDLEETNIIAACHYAQREFRRQWCQRPVRKTFGSYWFEVNRNIVFYFASQKYTISQVTSNQLRQNSPGPVFETTIVVNMALVLFLCGRELSNEMKLIKYTKFNGTQQYTGADTIPMNCNLIQKSGILTSIDLNIQIFPYVSHSLPHLVRWMYLSI